MFSVTLLMGESWEVRFSTSAILSSRVGMVFNRSFTEGGGGGEERERESERQRETHGGGEREREKIGRAHV